MDQYLDDCDIILLYFIKGVVKMVFEHTEVRFL